MTDGDDTRAYETRPQDHASPPDDTPRTRELPHYQRTEGPLGDTTDAFPAAFPSDGPVTGEGANAAETEGEGSGLRPAGGREAGGPGSGLGSAGGREASGPTGPGGTGSGRGAAGGWESSGQGDGWGFAGGREAAGQDAGWVGRRVRVMAGVDEALLDEVPEERNRYTGLGGVVIGTAAIAFVSMLAALTMVFGAGWTLVIAIPIALLWSALVGNFDRWLVSSGHGVMTWRQKAMVMFPRLIIAILLGVIIAEPVVLSIFGSAVEEQVKQTRQTENAAYEDSLRRCNPAPDAAGTIPAAPAECTQKNMTLATAGAPTERMAERDSLTRQRAELAKKVAADNKELKRREDLARRECNGTGGAGLTGQAGEGPNCARNRAEADQFKTDSKLAENTAKVAALDDKLTTLTEQLGGASTTYAKELTQKIAAKVKERAAQQGHIGLLERLEALGVLKGKSAMLAISIWLVTLFFVVIDVLPALVKFLSARTTYDELFTRRLEMRKQAHEKRTEVALRRSLLEGDDELRRLDEAEKEERARHAVQVNRTRTDLAARLR